MAGSLEAARLAVPVGGWWVFNVGIDEIFVVLFVCLVVFGPGACLTLGVGSLHAQARLRAPPCREVDAGQPAVTRLREQGVRG
jgi:hypothetical protein